MLHTHPMERLWVRSAAHRGFSECCVITTASLWTWPSARSYARGGRRASHTNGARGATERIREPRFGEASRAQREVEMSADGEGEGRRDIVQESEWERERENMYWHINQKQKMAKRFHSNVNKALFNHNVYLIIMCLICNMKVWWLGLLPRLPEKSRPLVRVAYPKHSG